MPVHQKRFLSKLVLSGKVVTSLLRLALARYSWFVYCYCNCNYCSNYRSVFSLLDFLVVNFQYWCSNSLLWFRILIYGFDWLKNYYYFFFFELIFYRFDNVCRSICYDKLYCLLFCSSVNWLLKLIGQRIVTFCRRLVVIYSRKILYDFL